MTEAARGFEGEGRDAEEGSAQSFDARHIIDASILQAGYACGILYCLPCVRVVDFSRLI